MLSTTALKYLREPIPAKPWNIFVCCVVSSMGLGQSQLKFRIASCNAWCLHSRILNLSKPKGHPKGLNPTNSGAFRFVWHLRKARLLDTKSTVCRGAIITVNAVHHGRHDIRWLRQPRCVENRSFLKCTNSISEQQGTLGRWCAFFDELRKAVLNSSRPEQTLTRFP